MESDTPSFFGLIDNGLSAPEHLSYESWLATMNCIPPTRKSGFSNRKLPVASLVAPKVKNLVTMPIILTVTDKVTLPLTRYQRVILTVFPYLK